MLHPRQTRPELRAQVERLGQDCHNRRSPALFDECVLALQQAAVLHDDAAFVLLAKAFALIVDQRGHPDEGLHWLHEALERSRRARWFDDQAELMVLIGRVHYARADYAAALELWTEALDVAQRAGELVQWGWAKLGVGQICDALGHAELAVAVYTELQGAIRGAGDSRADVRRLAKLRLFTHLNMGVNCLRLQRLDEARVQYEQGLQLARELGIADEEGEALMRLAEVASRQGRAEEARQALDLAQQVCEATSFTWARAHVHLLRAQLLGEAGDAHGALQQAEQGLQQAQQAGARHIEARAWAAVSRWAQACERLPQALAASRQAQSMHEALGRAATTRALSDIEDLAGIRLGPDRRLLLLAGDTALDGADERAAAQRLCDEGRQALAVDRVSYWVPLDDTLRPLVASGGEPPRQPLPADAAAELVERLRAGETVAAHHAAYHPDTWTLQEAYLAPRGVQSLLACPVMVAGQLVAALLFEQCARHRHWSRDAVVLSGQLVTIAGRHLAQRERRLDQGRIDLLNRQLHEANQALEQRIEQRTAQWRRTLAELEQARMRAEELGRAQGEFLARMSHEIRTPLNGVMGLAQVALQRGDGGDQAARTFAAILASGQHLLGVIDGVAHRPAPAAVGRAEIGGDTAADDGWRPQQPGKAGAACASAPALAGCSVLVAEDNEINQIVVQQMLELAGLRVTVVADGGAALEHVQARPDGYDAVLMDVHMPVMDGHAATRALRVLWPALPVIGLTADAMAEDLQRCLDAGMVEVLTKPVLADRLMAALGRHARRRAAT